MTPSRPFPFRFLTAPIGAEEVGELQRIPSIKGLSAIPEADLLAVTGGSGIPRPTSYQKAVTTNVNGRADIMTDSDWSGGPTRV